MWELAPSSLLAYKLVSGYRLDTSSMAKSLKIASPGKLRKSERVGFVLTCDLCVVGCVSVVISEKLLVLTPSLLYHNHHIIVTLASHWSVGLLNPLHWLDPQVCIPCHTSHIRQLSTF